MRSRAAGGLRILAMTVPIRQVAEFAALCRTLGPFTEAKRQRQGHDAGIG
jgi:hypothetical protein